MFLPKIFMSLMSAAISAQAAAIVGSSVEARQKPDTTCLVADAIQTASTYTGLEEGTPGIRPGLAESKTNGANFINFCAGRTLTNGKQATTGSCNGIPMGRIPSVNNMISAIITSPQPGDRLPANKTFEVSVQTSHLRAGFLVNPSAVYYTAPQDLDEKGDVIGHTHITIQRLGDRAGHPAAAMAPDPTKFAYFKGIDDAGDGRGMLRTTVDGGLLPGYYRVCTMVSARNHQPVIMPVAQRGAVDDCTKFEVFAPGAGGRCTKRAGRASGAVGA